MGVFSKKSTVNGCLSRTNQQFGNNWQYNYLCGISLKLAYAVKYYKGNRTDVTVSLMMAEREREKRVEKKKRIERVNAEPHEKREREREREKERERDGLEKKEENMN